MSATRTREREIKLASDRPLDAARVERIAESLGLQLTGTRRIRHEDVYFDDPGLRLARAGRGLRVRRADGGLRLTLKTELGGEGALRARDELEVVLVGEPPCRVRDLPAPIREQLAAFSTVRRLAPIAALDTQRTRLVSGHGDTAVEVSLDDVDVLDATGRQVGRFHECEVEIGPRCDPAVWTRFADALRSELGLTDAPANKLGRALALLGTPTCIATPGPLQATLPVSEAARRILLGHLDAMRRERERVLRSGAVDAVHALRVACRRGRTTLRTFAPWLPERLLRALKRVFRSAARACGPLRDLDVLVEDLRADREALPDPLRAAARAIRRHLARQRQRLLEDARRELGRKRRATQLARAAALLEAEPADASPPLGEVAPACVRAAAERVLGDAERILARPVATVGDDAIHELRLALKDLRYVAETFVELFGRALARFGKRMAGLQEITGRHHDASVAIERLLGLAGKRSGLRRRTLPVLGALAALAAQRVREARAALDASRDDLDPNDLRVLLDAILRQREPR